MIALQEARSAPGHCLGGVQSVERALLLLELLSEEGKKNRLTDLAARSGLSPSTVHRLLTTLAERHFVQFGQTDRMWHIGQQAFSVGASFTRQRSFVAPSLTFIRRLRDETRETANLGVANNAEIIVLSQVKSREIARAGARAGGTTPMLNSGMGKAILAAYSPDQVSAIVGQRGLQKLTPRSINSMSQLTDELVRVRQQGYAVDNEELRTGLRCVAAVVYDHQAEPLCAISASGMAKRFSEERMKMVGEVVSRTARELTVHLGGRLPG